MKGSDPAHMGATGALVVLLGLAGLAVHSYAQSGARGEDGGGRGEGGKQTDNSVNEAGAVYDFRISQ